MNLELCITQNKKGDHNDRLNLTTTYDAFAFSVVRYNYIINLSKCQEFFKTLYYHLTRASSPNLSANWFLDFQCSLDQVFVHLINISPAVKSAYAQNRYTLT